MCRMLACLLATWFTVHQSHAATYYVDAARSDDTGTATNWATAKKTIQAAVNLTIAGDTVLVTNGVYNIGTTVTPGYALNNRVVITNSINVRSINGPNVTIIEGSGTNFFNTSLAVRCVYIKRGLLEGFTLQNGSTYGNGLGSSDYFERNGGGVNMYNAVAGTTATNCIIRHCTAVSGGGVCCGTLNNCAISGNMASSYGGGAFDSTINNCTLSDNTAVNGGGGAKAGTLNSCTISNNTVLEYYGGGAFDGLLKNCIIADNTAPSGGGTYEGTLNNCTLSGNEVSSDDGRGGGAYGGMLNNCILSGNRGGEGGGTYGGTLNNCVLSGNTTSSAYYSGGGGTCYGTLNNCTLSGNTASKGGGSKYGTLNNCIVWSNAKLDGTDNNYESSTFYYSCTAPLPAGPGNIAVDPNFTDEEGLLLRAGSPCLDSGDNGYVTLPTDLAGNARIQNATVDMGAYEGGVLATAAPVFDPPSGTRFTNSLDVTITCATLNATVRYTLDGSEPTETNAVYSVPLMLTGSTSVWAKAFKDGFVAAQTIATYAHCVAEPIITPASGSVGTNTLAITITCATEHATIRYTLDESEPMTDSAEYTNALMLTQSSIVKAKAFEPGLADSAIVTAGYTVIQSVATPVLSPASGTVATNSLVVTVSGSAPGGSIMYTLDGSEPSSTNGLSEYSGYGGSGGYYGGSGNYSVWFVLTQSATVKVRALSYSWGMADSDLAVATYTIIQSITAPVLLPASGTYFSGFRKVTMSCATADVEIRYTTDGSTPTRSSPLYTKAFNISQTTTFNVKAFKVGMVESPAVTATYYSLTPLSVALDVTNLVMTTGGNADWQSQSIVTHDQTDAAQSGVLSDNQTSWMETAVTGPGTLSFWWRTSCEDDPDADNWDYLRFSVDGIEQRRLDGLTDWAHVTNAIGAGAHIVRWEYRKDESVSDGADCAWVDQLSFIQGQPTVTITTPVPVPYAWLNQYPVLLGLAEGDYEAAAMADVDGDGYAAWQEYVAGSNPTNRDSVLRSLITVSNGLPWVTWTPDLGVARVYTIEGRTNLTDAVWGPTNTGSRFFHVKVGMPE